MVFAGIGILIARRIVSTTKRANPEAFAALREEVAKGSEKRKTSDLLDMPKWAIILLVVMVLTGILGSSGVFSLNARALCGRFTVGLVDRIPSHLFLRLQA